MSKEILGNSYKYIVDESYGINGDGLIAIGTESIVYKGLKTKVGGGGLQFSCVLKFKPKTQIIDGKEINRLQVFKNEEWRIFQELRECRSVVRIDDVIDDLGDFSLPCEHISSGVIDSTTFFCVIEEYIDGWNLDEYCRDEFWKLRRVETLANGLRRKVSFNNFSDEEKTSVLANYNYNNQLKFQNQILLFMINLCEIMEFVTEQKNILHLDIKPENIMVTRYGRELVLIDFGRSRRVTFADRFAQGDMDPVDYSRDETQEKQYEYGTLGYAAPECFREAGNGSQFPFGFKGEKGRMSIESDIFSFGATFWECMNLFEMVTRSDKKEFDVYDFYKENCFSDAAYCNRDFSFTTTAYHQKLERIIKKCTRIRKGDFATSDKYYHSYAVLRKDLEQAKDSTPTIVKEENVKVRYTFQFGAAMISLALIFLIINGIYHSQAFKISEGKWNTLTANYNDTQFSKLYDISKDYIEASPSMQVSKTYHKVAEFTRQNNGNISEFEAEMLVDFLENIKSSVDLNDCIDEIMMHADNSSFKNISSQIVRLDLGKNCVGYELAEAIYNVEVGKTGIVEAFEILQKHKYNDEFSNAVLKLKHVLDTDNNVLIIMGSTGQSRSEILRIFDSIGE